MKRSFESSSKQIEGAQVPLGFACGCWWHRCWHQCTVSIVRSRDRSLERVRVPFTFSGSIWSHITLLSRHLSFPFWNDLLREWQWWHHRLELLLLKITTFFFFFTLLLLWPSGILIPDIQLARHPLGKWWNHSLFKSLEATRTTVSNQIGLTF